MGIEHAVPLCGGLLSDQNVAKPRRKHKCRIPHPTADWIRWIDFGDSVLLSFTLGLRVSTAATLANAVRASWSRALLGRAPL